MRKLTCPLCRKVVMRVKPSAGAAGTEIEGRCQNRRCQRPLIVWVVTDRGTIVLRRLDTAPREAA